jgi:hypothetical protein
MWRKFLIVGLVLGISMIFLSAPAAPAWAEEMIDEPLPVPLEDRLPDEERFTPCEQVDLEGVWTGRAARSDENSRHVCWDRFKVEVASDGTIVRGVYNRCDGERSLIARGMLVVSPRCIIRGRLATTDRDLYVVRNGGIRGDRLELIVGSGPESSDF